MKIRNRRLIISPVTKETHKKMVEYADKLHKVVSSPFFKLCLSFHGKDVVDLNSAGDEAWRACVTDSGAVVGAGVWYSFSCRALITDPDAPKDNPFALDRNGTLWMQ